jgi:type II secretory pathway pseudopilin PulG
MNMKLRCITKLLLQKNRQVNCFTLTTLLLFGGILAITGRTLSALSQSQNTPGEAVTTIVTLNRAQQAYFLENDNFATSIPALGVGIKNKTNNYRYVIVPANRSLPAVTHQARPLWKTRSFNRAVIGGVVAVPGISPGEIIALSQVCIATVPPSQGGPKGTELMTFTSTGLSCPTGYQRYR